MWNRGLLCFTLFVFLLKNASQKKYNSKAKSRSWHYFDNNIRSRDLRNEIEKSDNDVTPLTPANDTKIEESEGKANQSDNTITPETKDIDDIVTTIPLNNKLEEGKYYQKYHAEKISNVQANIVSYWPLGIIPYYFDLTSFDDILSSRVRDVMDFLEGASCVRFKALVEKPEDNQNWIHITNPTRQRECVHRGMHQGNGEIRMILGLDCLKRREVLHTLLHAMGFMDEVSHPYRDQYIRIMWNNIQPKYQNLFSIAPENGLNVEYDPLSIMHFHDRAFSKNGYATVVPLMPGLQIQPSDKLSQLDKMKLRLVFGHECNRRTVNDLLNTCKTVLRENGKAPSLKAAKEKRLDYISDPETDSSDYEVTTRKENKERKERREKKKNRFIGPI